MSINSISPIDGRYYNKTKDLIPYFSEFALIKYRVFVEIEYFKALIHLDLPQLHLFPKDKLIVLDNFVQQFSAEDAQRVKEIEQITNHDVKAVEYLIKDVLNQHELEHFAEFIHFGLTSQDINNTAFPLMMKHAEEQLCVPLINELIEKLALKVEEWKTIPMLARTHGQPASPTTVGKELAVFVTRIMNQVEQLQTIPHSGKFGGATGNMNAHYIAYPEIDWHQFAHTFLEQQLKLKRQYPTTQIEHYDELASRLDNLARINTILIDFARDIWTYISQDYFKQKIIKNEVGSSAMPHKVNPIDFENAEGNLGIANALFQHLSKKLPISRLQRDLTDSTVLRNLGVPIAHTIIAIQALLKGIDKLELNPQPIEQDLRKNWAVTAEAIQTILRREQYPGAYEALKEFSRNQSNLDEQAFHTFIHSLQISDSIKQELLAITPFSFIGKFS